MKVTLKIYKNGDIDNATVIEDAKDQLLHHLLNERWQWTSNKNGRTTGTMTGYRTRVVEWKMEQELVNGELVRWTYRWEIEDN